MDFYPASLIETSAKLRSGELDLITYIETVCNRIDEIDPEICALLPEPHRRERLLREATALQKQEHRPPLYGVLVGIKDLFNADHFPTQAGSALPAELFAGPEASVVRALKQAGALLLGKTAMDEFAYAEPSPTRNPHNLAHTPGGSSSGSAAAVAALFCPLALGTQTTRSITAPASFCGVVGFKPSYGRVPIDGVVMLSPSLDTVGWLTQDVESAELAASLLIADWQQVEHERRPVLGIPEGTFMTYLLDDTRQHFEQQVERLAAAGYTVKRLAMPWESFIENIYPQTISLLCAEMAHVHRDWVQSYQDLYRLGTRKGIEHGQTITQDAIAQYRTGQTELRRMIEQCMTEHEVDLLITPSQASSAPAGYNQTGWGGMTIPWSYAGLPTISLPSGTIRGLPIGLQGIARYNDDEYLLQAAAPIAHLLNS